MDAKRMATLMSTQVTIAKEACAKWRGIGFFPGRSMFFLLCRLRKLPVHCLSDGHEIWPTEHCTIFVVPGGSGKL